MGNNWLLWTLVSILVALFTVCSSVNTGSFSIVGYEPNDLHSEEGLLRLFETWRSRHGKLYHSLEEKAKRFNIFKRNAEFVELHNGNRRSSGHWVGFNKFADWSNEEFQAVYSKRISNPRRPLATPEAKKMAESCEAPSSLDWRKKGAVTGIKNQGDCGSCWSFSSTGAIEGINEITTGELISLSEQELVSCDTTNDGCEGGYMDYAFEWVIQNGGIDTESDYPYTGTDSTCISSKEEKKIVTIDGYTDVAESDSALLCAAAQQPISVGIDGSAIDFQLYTGGIYDGDCSSDPDDIDHAVLIVGYSSEESEDYWIVKNSWGTDWGIAGYFYLRRNTNLTYGVCAVNAMASYPTKEGSSPGPQPSPAVTPPPPPPPPSPPPPPPSPEPVQCGDYSYCASGETCCCVFELLDFCLLYGCCELENAVCCTGTSYCCPADYPICDVDEGLCLQGAGDSLGMEMTKRKRAHYKLPWERHGFHQVEEKSSPSLKWRRHAVQ